MTEITTNSGYDSLTLPHYDIHTLAERAMSALNDFRHEGYTLKVTEKDPSRVNRMLVAFIARDAEAAGLPWEIFNVQDSQVSFLNYLQEPHKASYAAADKWQRASALEIRVSQIPPRPVWSKKRK